MTKELKKFYNVLNVINSCSCNMMNQINKDLWKIKDVKKGYFIIYAMEAFKGMELTCHAFFIQAYSQISTLLRQIIEQVSICKILNQHHECLESFEKLNEIRLKFILEKNDKDLESSLNNSIDLNKMMLNLSKSQKTRKIDFAEFGWLLDAGSIDFGVDNLLNLAGFNNKLLLKRKFCNHFVHNNLSVANYRGKEQLKYIKENIYIIAILFNELLISYKDETNFNFVFNIDYEKLFDQCFKRLTEDF